MQELNDLENEILERQNIEKRLRRELLTQQKKKTTSVRQITPMSMPMSTVKTVSQLKSSIASERNSINRLKNSVAKLKRAVSDLRRNNKPTVYNPTTLIATPIPEEPPFTEQDIENIEPTMAEEQPLNIEEPIINNNNSPYVSSSIDRMTELPPSYQSFPQPEYVLEPTSLPVNENIEEAEEDLNYR